MSLIVSIERNCHLIIKGIRNVLINLIAMIIHLPVFKNLCLLRRINFNPSMDK